MIKHNFYLPTVSVSFSDVETIGQKYKIGQWFILPSGARGQYLGECHSGPVVNWVNGKFNERHAYSNMHLRRYARLNGSKV